jgi:hypothetical protein
MYWSFFLVCVRIVTVDSVWVAGSQHGTKTGMKQNVRRGSTRSVSHNNRYCLAGVTQTPKEVLARNLNQANVIKELTK